MFIYYIQYFIVFFISFLTSFKRHSEKYIAIIIYALLVILPVLKGAHVDRDFSVYQYYFQNIIKIDYVGEKIFYYEPINYILPFIANKINSQYFVHISLGIMTLIGVYLKLKSFDISNSFFLSVALYLTNFYLLHEWTQLRSGISSGIFLLSIKHIYNRDPIKYARNMFFACMFHYSSVLYLPLYFFSGEKINTRIYLIIIIIFSLLSILNIGILDVGIFSFIPKIQAYLELMDKGVFDELNIWNNPGFMINYIITLFILINIRNLKNYNKYAILLVKINIISILLYIFLAPLPAVATRASQMLGVVQLCLFPIVIFSFKEKWVPYFVIISVSLIYFYNHYIRLELLHAYNTWI